MSTSLLTGAALAAAAAVLVASPTRAGDDLSVPILVDAADDAARTAEPLTLGVPLAEGALLPGTDVTLEDASGTETPVETWPLALWNDGSVRVLGTHFQADRAPSSVSTYTLRAGTPVAPGPMMGIAGTVAHLGFGRPGVA